MLYDVNHEANVLDKYPLLNGTWLYGKLAWRQRNAIIVYDSFEIEHYIRLLEQQVLTSIRLEETLQLRRTDEHIQVELFLWSSSKIVRGLIVDTADVAAIQKAKIKSRIRPLQLFNND